MFLEPFVFLIDAVPKPDAVLMLWDTDVSDINDHVIGECGIAETELYKKCKFCGRVTKGYWCLCSSWWAYTARGG